MIYCIFAKLLVSIVGTFLSLTYFKNTAFMSSLLIGVFPIWAEVIASYITKVEPSKERRLKIKISDNVVDGIVFILIPAIWYFKTQGQNFIIIFILIFIIAGIWRLIKFVKTGLIENYFTGLPVTYTGYVWPLLILMQKIPYHNIILVILAWAMNSKHIKIKATNYEST